MAAYLALQIELGKLDYTAVANKFPQYKSDIDSILVADGKQDLITQ